LDHSEEIFWVVLPTNDYTSKIVKPSEQALDLPPPSVTVQHTAILRSGSVAPGVVRRYQLHTETFLNPRIQRIAVIGAISDQSLGSFAEETPLDGRFNKFCFMRRSAGHVHGERKTMAVADRHDFAAFAAACRADSRAPFFAELKLASMNDSLGSNFPRSRKSSASFWSNRVSSPERCHCWKRR